MRFFDPFFTVVVLRCTAGLGKLLVLTFLGVHTRLIIYFRYHDETYYALMTMRLSGLFGVYARELQLVP